ncbi:hypothetical protein BGZ68_010880 [Mortierella alpina]|nr:hypothetical protein BGZ68_010880 [Mortierella alpina]
MSQAVNLSPNARWTPNSYSESIAHALDLDSSGAARWLDSDAMDNHLATQQAAAEAGSHPKAKSGSFADILFSRADVVAGLIVICIGMLVLIVAVAIYFTNGRSWRSLRKATPTEGSSNMVINGENSDLESNFQRKSDDPPMAKSLQENHDANQTDLRETTGDKETTTTVSEPTTPSTARLEDPPSRSIFSFLKGGSNTRSQQPSTAHTADELSSTSSSAAALAKHMPQLTRTKARSSSEQKRSSTSGARTLFSPLKTASFGGHHHCMKANKTKKTKDASGAHSRRNGKHSSISIQIQDSDNATHAFHSAIPHQASPSPSTSPFAGISHPTRLQQLQQQQQQQLQQILEDGFSPNRPSRLSIGTTPTLLGLDMNSTSATRSSSVMGLYGSARSSPNGSMVDAASTRAIYCASLKSAISFATTASQAQLLSGPCSEAMEPDSKEIVLTTAVVTDADTGSSTTAEA